MGEEERKLNAAPNAVELPLLPETVLVLALVLGVRQEVLF